MNFPDQKVGTCFAFVGFRHVAPKLPSSERGHIPTGKGKSSTQTYHWLGICDRFQQGIWTNAFQRVWEIVPKTCYIGAAATFVAQLLKHSRDQRLLSSMIETIFQFSNPKNEWPYFSLWEGLLAIMQLSIYLWHCFAENFCLYETILLELWVLPWLDGDIFGAL